MWWGTAIEAPDPSALRLIATSAAKGGEPGIALAASAIGVPLVLVDLGDLAAAGMRATTRSERVMALAGGNCFETWVTVELR